MESTFFIAVDLAQANDYTVFTVIERIITYAPERVRGYTYASEKGREYHLRHIERSERGTPYPKIVERLKELIYSKQLIGKQKAVVIDVTGVGMPVWDMIQAAGLKRQINGIQITGGNNVTWNDNIYNVPKRDLISALQVAFQNGALKIAQGLPEAETLVRELTNFKVKININGHDQYEAWREGIHDDIVLSAAMGVWLAAQRIRCRMVY